MKIVIGCDIAGYELKCAVKKYLEEKGYELVDVGMTHAEDPIPYYEAASKVARIIQRNEAEKGILFCGTGMGVAIVANKFRGVYAAVVESSFSGKMCAAINKANVLTMGGWIIGPKLALDIVDQFLETGFTDGLDEFKDFLLQAVDEISKIENSNFK